MGTVKGFRPFFFEYDIKMTMKILVGALHANDLDNLEWFNVHYESFPYGSMFVMGEEGAGNGD